MLKLENVKMIVMAAGAVLGTSSVARADLICYGANDNPDDGQDWGAFCASGGWAYANVDVRESEHTVTINVTDHQNCNDGTHLECGFASSGEAETSCLTEGDYSYPADGRLPGVRIFCGCYTGTCLGD